MTEQEIGDMEKEIRARKDDGKHDAKIAVVSILLGCFAGVLGALLAVLLKARTPTDWR